MHTYNKSSLKGIALTHFVPCIFAGVFLLYVMNGVLPAGTISGLVGSMFTVMDYIVALILGLLIAGAVVTYHLYRNRRLAQVKDASRAPSDKRHIRLAALVGFTAGAANIMLLLHTEGIILLTVLVLFILYLHLKLFAHNIISMLHPDSVATWADVSELARIYLTMLTGFTLINATLEGLHKIAGTPLPFGFFEKGDLFLNSLYYTVVTMTTLGYGDIVPKTWDAKLLIIGQCLVSYVMFALVIGIITRGVIPARDKKE